MKLIHRLTACCASIAAAVFVLLVSGFASHCGAEETYPSRPGRLIVPFGAGASTDIVARIFAQRFSDVWGQTLVVENRPGAAGIIGTEIGAKATPDGYTLMTYGINQAITAALYKKLPYNHLRDFTPISLYGTMPNVLIVHPALPAHSVTEFVNLAKAKPGDLKYVSSGIGASPHLTMELFKTTTGIDIVHVPYKNAAQGYTDLVGGQLQAMFGNLPAALANVKAGRLRALAVTSAQRAEQLPNVPTIIESGIPGFEVTVWQGYAVPVGTPKPIVAKIHSVMMQALKSIDLRQRLSENGVMAAPMTSEAFVKFVNVETAKWQKAVTDSGTKIE